MFSNSGSIRVYIALKNKLIKQLKTIIEPGEKADRELENANITIQRMVQVGDLGERELKYDKDFDKNCIVLSSYANEPVDKVSIRRYFTMIEHYNEIIKKRQK